MKVKLYKTVRRHKLELVWSIDVDSSFKDKGHKWFTNALNHWCWDIDQDQLEIRNQFPLSGVDQGDLLGVGGSQGYIR